MGRAVHSKNFVYPIIFCINGAYVTIDKIQTTCFILLDGDAKGLSWQVQVGFFLFMNDQIITLYGVLVFLLWLMLLL